MKTKIKIFLVDDDALYLRLLEIQFLEKANFEVLTFSSGEECLENLSQKPDLIVLDYMLSSINKEAMNGIKILDKIKEFNPNIQVVILSAQDKIEVAIDCMHHAAFDYVIKSETAFLRLQKIINGITEINKLQKQIDWYMDRM